jgi:hypothetical protein
MGEHLEHREVLLKRVSDEGTDSTLTGGTRQLVQQERPDAVVLTLVGDHEGDFRLGRLWVLVVTPNGDETAVMLGHKTEAVPIIHPRKPLDLLGHQVPMEREEPEVAGTIGQVVMECNQGFLVVRTNRPDPKSEPLEGDDVKLQF